MEIYLDGALLDVDRHTMPDISLECGFGNVDCCAGASVGSFSLPDTPNNRHAMGDAASVCGTDLFNSAGRRFRIDDGGCTVACGVAVLVAVTVDTAGELRYECRVEPEAARWADTARGTALKDTPVEFDCVFGGDAIAESWTWDKPVRFLPVLREGFEAESAEENLLPPLRVMSERDYHPFVHVGTLVEAIFSQAGYALHSEFMRSDLFRSLYMSGALPGRDTARLKSRMDFRAGRFADVTAEADRSGRVYADPYVTYNTVGNVVDTADPFERQEGVAAEGVYSNGRCFVKEGDRVVFRPRSEVAVSFEIALSYRTEYVIESRERLRGVDTVCLGTGDVRHFGLANTFGDRRGDFKGNRAYRLVVFSHEAGAAYRFEYDVRDSASVTVDFSTRTAAVSVGQVATVGVPRLMVKDAASGGYRVYDGDWALYDGYVAERGEKDVEVVLTTRPEILAPGSPKYFDSIYFGGGEPGMRFTLGRRTAVTPLFLPVAVEGARLDFGSVFAYGMSQMKLLEALVHMFDLRMVTDDVSKTVYVEPADSFGGTSAVDWSWKTATGMPLRVEELGADTARTMSLSYRTGDAAVAGYNRQHGTSFGSWSAVSDDVRASAARRDSVNPLFTPTINERGVVPGAPSASVPAVGDSRPDDDSDMNFMPKIVSYTGMTPLGAGESWGWPSSVGLYPLSAFHDPKAGISLCFEDRDGMSGLHRFHDGRFEARRCGKRITAYMCLTPRDVETLQAVGDGEYDMRSRFRIRIGQEVFAVRLAGMEGYRPGTGEPVKCVFEKL